MTTLNTIVAALGIAQSTCTDTDEDKIRQSIDSMLRLQRIRLGYDPSSPPNFIRPFGRSMSPHNATLNEIDQES